MVQIRYLGGLDTKNEAFCVTEHITTDCLLFPDIFDRPVVAKFDLTAGQFRWRSDSAPGRRATVRLDFGLDGLSARRPTSG